MRLRAIIVALVALAAIALPAGSAAAAVPDRKPTATYKCPGQRGKVARVWIKTDKGGRVTQFAVDNACKKVMGFGVCCYGSGDYYSDLRVMPGVHFNWTERRIKWARSQGAQFGGVDEVHWHDHICDWDGPSTTVTVVAAYNKVGPDTPYCPEEA